MLAGCSVCNKEVDISQKPPRVINSSDQNVDGLVLFNYNNQHDCMMFCTEKCFHGYNFRNVNVRCVMCDQRCESDHWFVAVKFANMGGWTSLKSICSKACRKRHLAENTNDIELNYQCFHCKRLSKTKLRACTRCKVSYYCDETCQRASWPTHKLTCRK
jgi:hypothetical protein